MSTVDPDRLAELVREQHGYSFSRAGAASAAAMAAASAAAIAALAGKEQFHEEPANFAIVLAALAPGEC